MAEELIKLGGYVVQGHGSDETVLWETNNKAQGSANVTLTEDVTNFEYVRLIVGGQQGMYALRAFDFYIDGYDPTTLSFWVNFGKGAGNQYLANVRLGFTDNRVLHTIRALTYVHGFSTSATFNASTVDSAEDMNCIFKVIGINRKEQA